MPDALAIIRKRVRAIAVVLRRDRGIPAPTRRCGCPFGCIGVSPMTTKTGDGASERCMGLKLVTLWT